MEGEAYAEAATSELKTPNGTMKLRPLQALALVEAALYGGAVCMLPVGQGKTLVSFLLPTIMEVKTAILLVPGSLRKKTFKDFYALEKHWQRHERYYIMSYEEVSNNPDALWERLPELIVADEAQKLKSIKAGCTKRVQRYWNKRTVEGKKIYFVPMSGTLSTRTFFDFWHLQAMALPDYKTILPYNYNEAEHWCMALDVDPGVRVGLGALEHFGENLVDARKGYGNFIRQVPGVIAANTVDVGASIQLSFWDIESKKIRETYDFLISHWELPNGDTLCTGTEIWRHAREIAMGFYYIWTEQPPDEWAQARLEYGRFIRGKLAHSRKYETPSQIDEAYYDAPEVAEWKRIEKTFIPETEPVWFSDTVMTSVAFLAKLGEPKLVWYKQRAVGERLAQAMPVYGSKGENIKTGQHIYDQKLETVAVSINAMTEGFNLQQWSNNVILTPPSNGRIFEQLIGRTHRNGQLADEVNVKLVRTLPTAEDDYIKAKADAEYIEATTAQRQKLNLADFGE